MKYSYLKLDPKKLPLNFNLKKLKINSKYKHDPPI